MRVNIRYANKKRNFFNFLSVKIMIFIIHYAGLKQKPCYSKTPIYRGVWGQGNIRGKSGSAVNRGFVWFTLCMFSPIWGKGNGRGISGFAVNRGAVNRGFTVL